MYLFEHLYFMTVLRLQSTEETWLFERLTNTALELRRWFVAILTETGSISTVCICTKRTEVTVEE